jgi:hypothetical protein
LISWETFSCKYHGTANTSFIASDVQYSQYPSISVSSIEIVGSSVIFTGEGFPTDQFASSSVQGLSADSVTVTNSTSLVASFGTTGIPSADELPNLLF